MHSPSGALLFMEFHQYGPIRLCCTVESEHANIQALQFQLFCNTVRNEVTSLTIESKSAYETIVACPMRGSNNISNRIPTQSKGN